MTRSRERIIEAAVELLDAEGERGLTFRALATRLATGPGAIYWHVANKDELLAATTEAIVDAALADVDDAAAPADTIRAVAIGLFDAIDLHPWVGAQLAREPWQSAMVNIFERVGAQLLVLRRPGQRERQLFFAASALVNYIVGVAGQNAANARHPAAGGDRDAFLAAMANRWTARPALRRMAKQLRHHDDRAQFLAGIDLILAGLNAMQPRRSRRAARLA